MKNLRKTLFFALLLILTISSLAFARTNSSSERKKAMTVYKNILATNPYADGDGGFKAHEFMLKDVNNDGIPELFINAVTKKEGYCLQVFSYSKGKDVFLYNSWTLDTYYYSSKKKSILIYNNYNGRIDYSVYKFNSTCTKMNCVASISSDSGKYYDGNKTITKAQYSKLAKSCMSSMKKITFPYENTKTNRDKYLK